MIIQYVDNEQSHHYSPEKEIRTLMVYGYELKNISPSNLDGCYATSFKEDKQYAFGNPANIEYILARVLEK